MMILLNLLKLLCCVGALYAGVQSNNPRRPWVSGNLGVDTLLLTYRSWSDSSGSLAGPFTIVAAADKSFSFDLPDSKAAYTVELGAPGQSGLVRFLAVPGEEAVVTNWNGKITGSDFYRRWNELEKELTSLKLKAMQVALHYDPEADKDPEKVRQKEEAIKVLWLELHMRALSYVKDHAEDPVSVLALEYMSDEDLFGASNLLGCNLRKGPLSSYVSNLIGQAGARLKQPPHSDLENMAVEAENTSRALAEKVYTASAKKRLENGDPVPTDLLFTDIDGNNFSLGCLKGKYIYIDVWATWCAPCCAELPYLGRLEATMKGRNIAFVSISLDKNHEAWKKKVKGDGLGGIQVYAGGSREVFQRFFSCGGIPHFILIDREGKIIKNGIGAPSLPSTTKTLLSLEGI